MKVCHITTVHTNRYDVRIFEKECSSIAKAGFDTTLIVNDQLSDEVKNDVKIFSLREKPKNRWDRANRIAHLMLKRAQEIDADIYHVHDPELLRIAVKLRKNGKKVIFDSHEFTAEQILTKPYLPTVIRGMISKLYRNYEIVMLNKLSGLVFPCTYNGRDFFEKVKIPKVLIGNYPTIKILERDTYDENVKKQKKLCYVGGISESRGIVRMVNVAHLSGYRLVLIGEISEAQKKQYEKLPGWVNVDCLGKLSHDIAMNEISKCTIGLSLLQNQGQYALLDNLPTKLYEYMAMGMPAVVSDFPYYKKVLEKYQFGLAVNPSNDEEIAIAIKRIIGDQKLQEKMAAEGKRAIREEMNWEKDVQKLIVFYEQLCVDS